MANQQERLRKWLENGKKRKATHVIVAYNNSERDFRPIYVSTNQNVRSKLQEVNNDYTLTPVEVYNLSMDTDRQLTQARAWNA